MVVEECEQVMMFFLSPLGFGWFFPSARGNPSNDTFCLPTIHFDEDNGRSFLQQCSSTVTDDQ
jgi:hypothetical protein